MANEQHTPHLLPSHEARAHSLVSASSAHRWLHCVGSVTMCEQVPAGGSSEYAKEGTQAHELAELMLKVALHEKSLDAGLDFISPDLWDEDMIEHVTGYVRMVWGLIETRVPKRVLLEERVTLDSSLDMSGTADVVFAYREGKLVVGQVIDLKYGMGVVVEAKDNPQLAYYSCALDETYGTGKGRPFDRIEATIYQPRAYHPEGPARTAVFHRDDLSAWNDRLKKGAKAALALLPGPPAEETLVAGNHCQFCAAKSVCRAFARSIDEKAGLGFADDLPAEVTVPSVSTLSDEQVGRVLEVADRVREFVAAVEDFARGRYLSGNPVPGWKVVSGKGKRKWKDPKEVAEGIRALGLNPYRDTLRTLTDVEKEAKKAGVAGGIDHLTERTKPSLSVVPESDKRPGFNPSLEAAKAFDALPDE